VTGTMEFYDIQLVIGNVIIPTDELIFFRGVGVPPSSDGQDWNHPQELQ